MPTRTLSSIGAACATMMAAAYLLAPGLARSHPALFTPLVIVGAIWVARNSTVNGD